MPRFTASRQLGVTPDLAYCIAADVESYKMFLPLLRRSTMRGKKRHVGDALLFDAELVVAYDKLNLRESFISQVTCEPTHRKVTASSTDGPFKNLHAVWIIEPSSQGSKVSISIDYTMHSMLLQLALSGLMDMAVSRVMAAFEERARILQASA